MCCRATNLCTVKLATRGHGLTRTFTQPWTKSYVPIDFCPFTPSYMDKLVMCGWWTPKNVPWNKITLIYVDT